MRGIFCCFHYLQQTDSELGIVCCQFCDKMKISVGKGILYVCH